MRVAVFVTCLADTFFPQAGRATFALRERFGLRWTFLQPRREAASSATGDIELERVNGVHGPRTLEGIIVAEQEAPR